MSLTLDTVSLDVVCLYSSYISTNKSSKSSLMPKRASANSTCGLVDAIVPWLVVAIACHVI